MDIKIENYLLNGEYVRGSETNPGKVIQYLRDNGDPEEEIRFKPNNSNYIYYIDPDTLKAFEVSNANNPLLYDFIINYGKEITVITEHFDPHNLQPFDRVLVRDLEEAEWRIDIFECYRPSEKYSYNCIKIGVCKYCIPYNDDTKHILRTNKKAPDYYEY